MGYYHEEEGSANRGMGAQVFSLNEANTPAPLDTGLRGYDWGYAKISIAVRGRPFDRLRTNGMMLLLASAFEIAP